MPVDPVLAGGALVAAHRPWPRIAVDRPGWNALVARLASDDLGLAALWGEPGTIHLALADEGGGSLTVASLDCPDGSYPAVSLARPAAQRLERAAFDLWGLKAEGAVDQRPWLAHPAAPYPFLAVEGEGVHIVPVGPVHAGIIEPGHFRFHANGELVVRLEQRLGYVHKGIESLLAGAELDRASRLIGRVSGDSTVAYASAFARAVEAATGVEPPPRAVWLRALMAELERLANHLGDIGAIANDASFTVLHAHLGVLREAVLQAAEAAFGHRLMMDRVVPGGVAVDVAAGAGIGRLIDDLGRRFPPLVAIYDNTVSLQDRTVGTGTVPAALAARFGAGGFVGRACGRAVDVRRSPGYAPYDELGFTVPVEAEGDVNARVWVRIHEVEQSLGLVRQIIDRMPDGEIQVPVPAVAGEGLGLAESFRGDVLVWLRLGPDGRVLRCHPRDPSWFQWPLLEAAIKDNIIADFPLCNKSFNCSYSGHDL